MKKSFLILTLSILLTNSIFAQTLKLQEGEKAPYTGFLLTEKSAEEAAKNKLRVTTLEAMNMTNEQLIEYHQGVAIDSRKKLSEAKYDSYMNVVGAFVLGVLVTGFAAKMNQKIGDM